MSPPWRPEAGRVQHLSNLPERAGLFPTPGCDGRNSHHESTSVSEQFQIDRLDGEAKLVAGFHPIESLDTFGRRHNGEPRVKECPSRLVSSRIEVKMTPGKRRCSTTAKLGVVPRGRETLTFRLG